MKQVISLRDLEEMLRNGKDVRALPADALLTPSARDFLRDLESSGSQQRANAGAGRRQLPARPKPSPPGAPRPSSRPSSTRPRSTSSSCRSATSAAGSGSAPTWTATAATSPSASARTSSLCTPTLVSKGFMKPEDMCLVDLEGNQLAGTKKRTSEILMHLQIMKRQPQRGRLGALSSALQHRLCRGRRRAAHLHDPGV